MLFGTIRNEDEDDCNLVAKLFEQWRPRVACLAFPPGRTRSQVLVRLPEFDQAYTKKLLCPRHQNFGGVTTSKWTIAHISRHAPFQHKGSAPLMTTAPYKRPLQTALDDTKRPSYRGKFEACQGLPDSIAGYVKERESEAAAVVYDAKGLAPDVGELPPDERLIWVLSESVWQKTRGIRRIDRTELLAIWDYEGKLESKHWKPHVLEEMIEARLASPPAKILRAVAHPVFEDLQSLRRGWCWWG